MGGQHKKNTKKKTALSTEGVDDVPVVQDDRFKSLHWDPRFGRVPKKVQHAPVDERFKNALKSNPAFDSSKTSIDRFGRRKQKKEVTSIGLKRILDAAESSGDSDSVGDDDDGSDNDNEVIRHVGDASSSDESESDSDIEDVDHAKERLEDIPLGNATKRLAIVGLDWSATRAVDIFASLSSFCPSGEELLHVAVHPSKLGLQRLAEEAKLGPQVISKLEQKVVEHGKGVPGCKSSGAGAQKENDEDDEHSSDDDENGTSDSDDAPEQRNWKEQKALRKYEEERLQYFYAVATFKDIKGADAVYEQCDGVEYAQSGRSFDLRFIPDEMKIETKPRDEASCMPDGYDPPNVAPSVLNNSKVKLTWDADDPDRIVLKKRTMGRHEIHEDNLKAYLASASEDEDENGLAKAEQKRKLLLGLDENDEKAGETDEDMELEVKFEPGMFEKGEEIIRRKEERRERENETAWEAHLRRISENKAEKRRKHKAKISGHDGSFGDHEDGTEGNPKDVKNPTFDDPFFSADKPQQKAPKKRQRKDEKADVSEDEETHTEKKRKTEELELLLADDIGKSKDGSLRAALATAESDDDDDRLRRRKEKRTRGRRRSEKERRQEAKIAKPSALDTSDSRFQGLFDSHLFAMDPTHPKFKKNDTTQRILKEKARRAKAGVASVQPFSENASKAVSISRGIEEADNVMKLAARIKSKAKTRTIK